MNVLSALEWFANRLTERGLDYSIEDFEKAKEMEEQQAEHYAFIAIECHKQNEEKIISFNTFKAFNKKFKKENT